MATKIKADIIIEYNVLPVYFDDDTKMDNILTDFDYSDLMDVLNTKNADEFPIVLISFDLLNSRLFVFSESYVSKTQQIKSWYISDFTVQQQTIINNFITLL